MVEKNEVVLGDCIEVMKGMGTGSVKLTLTDIPYNEVNRASNGLRKLDKEDADILTFDLDEFLNEVYRVTEGTIIIFCGKQQFSKIYSFFAEKQQKKEGTVRQLIWKKTNPSPMNGQHIYLSGIENAVWFKKKGGTFNAHCKNTVFEYPCGRAKLHPTEKNHNLLEEILLDNSAVGDMVFDPCAGSGSHLLVARNNGRTYFGVELNENYFNIAKNRLSDLSYK